MEGTSKVSLPQKLMLTRKELYQIMHPNTDPELPPVREISSLKNTSKKANLTKLIPLPQKQPVLMTKPVSIFKFTKVGASDIPDPGSKPEPLRNHFSSDIKEPVRVGYNSVVLSDLNRPLRPSIAKEVRLLPLIPNAVKRGGSSRTLLPSLPETSALNSAVALPNLGARLSQRHSSQDIQVKMTPRSVDSRFELSIFKHFIHSPDVMEDKLREHISLIFKGLHSFKTAYGITPAEEQSLLQAKRIRIKPYLPSIKSSSKSY